MTIFNYNNLTKLHSKKNFILMNTVQNYLNLFENQDKNIFKALSQLIENLTSINKSWEFWVNKGTPFLFAYITNLIFYEENKIEESSFVDLFFLFLDSYFFYLKPFKVNLHLQNSETICLPKLTNLLKINKGELTIEKNEYQDFLVNGNTPIFEKITFAPDNNIRYLNGAENSYQKLFSLVNSEYLNPLNKNLIDIKNYLPVLQAALALIAKGDDKLHEALMHLIKFYVPLESVENYSASFSLRPYVGVVFLSFNTDIFAIAENIIREYGNNLLNIYIACGDLVKNNNTKHYSPYSISLSTPLQLLMNMYNFSLVTEFFENCLMNPSFNQEHDLIKYRLTVQQNRLSLAFMQARKMEWTQEGSSLIESLRHRFLHTVQSNKLNIANTPDIIFQHLAHWKEKYPEYLQDTVSLPIAGNLVIMESEICEEINIYK